MLQTAISVWMATFAGLPELAALKNRYGTLLMVDDAHAEGVIGPGGRGTEAYFGLQGTIDIQTGTLSKSLASEGGYVASSKEIIAYLTCRARPFVFSTFISPHDTAAAYAALQVLQEEGPILMKTLREHTRFMREGLHTLKLPVLPGITPLIPIIVGSVERAAAIDAFLKERGILLSAIRPPSVPMGTARLRLTLFSSPHKASASAGSFPSQRSLAANSINKAPLKRIFFSGALFIRKKHIQDIFITAATCRRLLPHPSKKRMSFFMMRTFFLRNPRSASSPPSDSVLPSIYVKAAKVFSYCASDTSSSHSLDVLTPSGSMARWLNQASVTAPCQCLTPAGM